MNLLLIFSIVGFSFAFTEGWMKIFETSVKPFSCPTCLSLWIGFIIGFIIHDTSLIFIPYMVAKIINKWLWI